jgi:hypothetical protein
MWSSTKLGRQKIPTFCFVTLGRCLSTTAAPRSAYPWIVVFHLTLSLSLSRVSPFTVVLTNLSYIAMKIKGIWWEFDGNMKNLWKFFGNLMRTKGYWLGFDGNWVGTWRIYENSLGTWWEQKDIDWVLMGIWWEHEEFMKILWELDENKRILMGYWWEQEEFDEMRSFWELDRNKRNLFETWWEQKELDWNLMGTKNFDGLLMGIRGIWRELFGNLMRTKGILMRY